MRNFLILIRRMVYLGLAYLDRHVLSRRPQVVVFCYHSISNTGTLISVTPESFRQQITYLHSHFDYISLDDLKLYLAGRRSFAKPVFHLTFDDGYKDVLKVEPFLSELGIHPTIFVISDSAHADRTQLGNSLKLLEIKELKALSSKGWEIGSHSDTHPFFHNLTEQALKREVDGSKVKLENSFAKKITAIAYPRGKYTGEVLREVQLAGYQLGFTMDDSLITPATEALRIPRVAINSSHTFSEFLASFSPSIIRLRGLIKSTRMAKLYD